MRKGAIGMFGRRMLWTTLIGAAIALVARMRRNRNHRNLPAFRLFRRNRWARFIQPVMQMTRR